MRRSWWSYEYVPYVLVTRMEKNTIFFLFSPRTFFPQMSIIRTCKHAPVLRPLQLDSWCTTLRRMLMLTDSVAQAKGESKLLGAI